MALMMSYLLLATGCVSGQGSLDGFYAGTEEAAWEMGQACAEDCGPKSLQAVEYFLDLYDAGRR
jgi:hypothetical protein